MKEVTVTKQQLVNISGSLSRLSLIATEAWYPISRNIKSIRPLMDEISQIKEDMFNKLAEKDEKGQLVYINPEEKDITKKIVKFKEGKQEEADKIWGELMKEEVTIEVYQFTPDKLGDVKLNPVIIEPLIDIIIVDKIKKIDEDNI